jgi:DNA (cytosine-5)-methyltransferase 1
MKYGSVCSGIEAASVAWHNLGWEPQWFSEIEQFPSEVLKYRFPHVPNLGDMTTINQNPIADERPIDLLVGGTPCQSFSVAGLRKGLADPRGNLMLTFLSIADKFRPKWVVWENVPGVLSSNGGKDFGTFLGALGELGYGFAYRVLDAQYFGVAQRRRRVFVVGYLGDWRVAAAVLFERESLQGNPKPSEKKREEVATNAEGSVGESGDSQPIAVDFYNQCITGDTFQTVSTRINASTTGGVMEFSAVAQPIAFKVRGGCEGGGKGYLGQEEQAFTISATQDQQIAQPIAVDVYNQKTTGDKFGVVREQHGTNMNAVLQPIAVDWRTAQVDQGITQTLKTDLAKMSGPCIAVDVYNQSIDGQTSATITEAVGGTNTSGPKVMQPMAFDWQCGGDMRGMNLQEKTQLQRCQTPAVMHSMAIRRLTPKECERLQGFPDDWTKIPYRNKDADQCPDGPRYKACGNSMAVPVMRWIGERINLIESML